jgi:hypothetical protein
MLPLATHFQALLSNTQPPEDRLEAARTLPDQVRGYLKDCEAFASVEPHSRLAGSYAQNLCVGDVKDVDFLVRVEGDPDHNEPEAKQLIGALRDALDGLPEALGFDGYAGVDIERARRSVHVYIVGRGFHLDVVPCIAPSGFEKPLYVPDRGFNKWIPSHPVGYIALLNRLNNEHDKKVKPLIRLLKHFRNYHFKARKPKSYWLGSLAVHHVQKTLDTEKSLPELFHDLLDAVYRQYDHLLWTDKDSTPHIKDPMLGHDISWNWGRPAFETFMRRVDKGRCWAAQALEAQQKEDLDEAVKWWRKVFGDEFPQEVSKEASDIARANLPGIAFVSAAGQVTERRPESGVFTRTMRTTFHGDV